MVVAKIALKIPLERERKGVFDKDLKSICLRAHGIYSGLAL
jgi:hypothetical protein